MTYEFDDGLLWTHRCQSLNNQLEWALNLNAYGDQATALVSYRGKSYLRGGPKHFGGGEVVSLYDQGASATLPRSTRTSSRAGATIPPCSKPETTR